MEYIQPYKLGNPDIRNNTDRPWGHSVKWNKSDNKRQILYDLILYGIFQKKKNKLIEKENWFLVTRAKGWGEGELVEDDLKVQSSSNKRNKY